MLEAVVAVFGVFLCWLVAVFVFKDDMSLRRYAVIAVLAMLALYFVIRFIHWAWITPIPFLGR